MSKPKKSKRDLSKVELERLPKVQLTDEQVASLTASRNGGGDHDGEARIVLTRAADLKPERIEWAWEPYFPLGAISLVAGQQGLGKSTLQATLAGGFTNGEMPGDLFGEPVPVLMATAEDSLRATVVPRLLAAEADMDLVSFIEVSEAGFAETLDLAEHIEALREKVRETGARVLMLDPLVSFLDQVDSHKDQSVRRALAPLAAMAADEGVAVNGLIHLNKRDSHDALARVSGSVAFTALARSVLVLGVDRQDDEALHLVHAKSNLSKHGSSLRCHIESAEVDFDDDSIATSTFVFDGESDARAEDLLASPVSSDDRSVKDEALHFLRSELGGGKQARQKELVHRAKSEFDISIQTLRRAKKALGVESAQVRDGDESFWVWFLPDEPKPKRKKRRS